MLDKEKIKQEIKIVVNRRLNLLNGDYFILNEETNGFTNEIMEIIDSLSEEPKCVYNRTLAERNKYCKFCSVACGARIVEPASEDLEEEINNWRHNHFHDRRDKDASGEYLKRESQLDLARHFAEWQKQQMMKDAVLETKVMKDCDGDGIETPYEEWLTLENTEIPYIPDNLELKEGDKVKIIIIKEEQQ